METIWTVLGMLFTVVAILALAYFFTKYFARWKMGTLKGPQKGGRMRVMDQLPLNGDTRVLLVQVGARYLLLGQSSDGLRTLSELSPEEAELWDDDSAEQAPSESRPTFPSFREAFIDTLKQKRK